MLNKVQKTNNERKKYRRKNYRTRYSVFDLDKLQDKVSLIYYKEFMDDHIGTEKGMNDQRETARYPFSPV